MNSVKELAREVHIQPVFDTDARKFLIDSGASTHLWNRRRDFSSYPRLSHQEQEQDKVLGVNGKTIKLTEFRQPLQVQSHLEMPGILVQLGHIQRT